MENGWQLHILTARSAIIAQRRVTVLFGDRQTGINGINSWRTISGGGNAQPLCQLHRSLLKQFKRSCTVYIRRVFLKRVFHYAATCSPVEKSPLDPLHNLILPLPFLGKNVARKYYRCPALSRGSVATINRTKILITRSFREFNREFIGSVV